MKLINYLIRSDNMNIIKFLKFEYKSNILMLLTLMFGTVSLDSIYWMLYNNEFNIIKFIFYSISFILCTTIFKMELERLNFKIKSKTELEMCIKLPYEIILQEINDCNKNNEAIWLIKLIENLDLSRDIIIRYVDNLIDFNMIKGMYGETKKGYAGYRYYITDIGEYELNKLINK